MQRCDGRTDVVFSSTHCMYQLIQQPRRRKGLWIMVALLMHLWLLLHAVVVDASFLSEDNTYITEMSRDTVNPVNWEGAYPIEKTAYVFAHFEQQGTPREEEQLTALRITIRTLKLTNTKRDIVVLLSEQARESTKELLAEEGGLIVKLVPPVASISECEHKYLPIHAWGLTEYERVIYIGQGTLVLLNMDELFLCGEFCMVWSSWLYFSDLVMVLKPDPERYQSLLHHVSEYDVYDRYGLSAGHWFSRDECDLHAQEFYLAMFGGTRGTQDDKVKHLGLGRAPLFDVTKGQSHELVERLPYNYNINAMHYYEYFSFHLIRRLTYATLTIPGHSMGWWGRKPYTYHLSWFFSLDLEYSYWRETLLEESFGLFFISRIVFVMVFLVATDRVLPRVHAHMFSHVYRRAVIHKTRVLMATNYGLDIVGLGTGIVFTLLSVYLSLWSPWWVSADTHPKFAWWIFFPTLEALVFFFLKLISLMYFNSAANTDKEVTLLGITHSNAPKVTIRRLLVSSMSVLVCFYMCYSTYVHFAVKIGVTYFVFLTALAMHVLVFRGYFRDLAIIFNKGAHV